MRTKALVITINKATVDDAKAIRDIQAITWLATYPNSALGITRQAIRERIEGANGEKIAGRITKWCSILETSGPGIGQTYVARIDGKVVGFGSARIDENNQSTIGALYVVPSAQGLGVGKKLMAAVLAWQGSDQDILVIVASYNHKAIRFYQSFGFAPTGRVKAAGHAPETGDVELPETEMILRTEQHRAIQEA